MAAALVAIPTSAAGTVTGSIVPGGSAFTLTIANPGDTGSVTFSGTQGQRVSLNISSVTISLSYVSIQKPDGTNLVSSTAVFTSGKFIDVQTLPQSGTYTISVQPQNSATGSMVLTLYDVPADVTGAITPGGAPVGPTTTVPGQNARYTFSGTQGQRKVGSSWRTLARTKWDNATRSIPTSLTYQTTSCAQYRIAAWNPLFWNPGSTLSPWSKVNGGQAIGPTGGNC